MRNLVVCWRDDFQPLLEPADMKSSGGGAVDDATNGSTALRLLLASLDRPAPLLLWVRFS